MHPLIAHQPKKNCPQTQPLILGKSGSFKNPGYGDTFDLVLRHFEPNSARKLVSQTQLSKGHSTPSAQVPGEAIHLCPLGVDSYALATSRKVIASCGPRMVPSSCKWHESGKGTIHWELLLFQQNSKLTSIFFFNRLLQPPPRPKFKIVIPETNIFAPEDSWLEDKPFLLGWFFGFWTKAKNSDYPASTCCIKLFGLKQAQNQSVELMIQSVNRSRLFWATIHNWVEWAGYKLTNQPKTKDINNSWLWIQSLF